MSDKTDYQTIFDNVESSLIRIGNKRSGKDDMRDRLAKFKIVPVQTFTDADYFRKLVHVVFFSGFRAATVEQKLPTIDKYLSHYETVAAYRAYDTGRIMADETMIRHKRKIQACVENAKVFKNIVVDEGSFSRYIDKFSPNTSFDKLMGLRKDLIERFEYLSNITSLHFLMDIGMPVLKPDTSVRRIFYRLRLIDSDNITEGQLLKAVEVGHRFAQATGHPIRYIDAVFAAYGQVRSTEDGLQQGICLRDNPRCPICGVTKYCRNVVIIDGTGQSFSSFPPEWKGGTVPVPVIEMDVVDSSGKPFKPKKTRHPLSPPLKSKFEGVYQAIERQPNARTPELETTGGGRFVAEAKKTTDGRRFISLPHSNRIYKDDWGYTTNNMGKTGQWIGHYAVPLDEWAWPLLLH